MPAHEEPPVLPGGSFLVDKVPVSCYFMPERMVKAMQIRNMARCALFTALMVLCAWISIPLGDIAFTLQSLALFTALGLLGGGKGSLVCLAYLLLGAAGFPCFSGFQGGMGVILGPTGGFLWGFLAAALVYWLITALFGQSSAVCTFAMVLGMLVCYGCGCFWYWKGYTGNNSLGIWAVAAKCVLPYLLPDALKLLVARELVRRLKPYLS